VYSLIQGLKKTALWKTLVEVVSVIGIGANVGVFLAICAVVLFRYILRISLFSSEEIIILMAYWLYFFGGAYASMADGHIKADLIGVYVKNQRVLYILRFIAKLIESVVTAFFAVWGWRYFVNTGLALWPTTPGLLIPQIWMMLPVGIGYTLMCFFATCQTLELSGLAFGDYTQAEGGQA